MIVDGSGVPMGRLASFVAKQALKGKEVQVINCKKVIVTGNRRRIQEEFERKRRRVGSSQKGPKYPRSSERVVKRAIRGMLPNYRSGRGALAWKRIKCYSSVPEGVVEKEVVKIDPQKKIKYSELKDLTK